jgi:hypothetical protein
MQCAMYVIDLCSRNVYASYSSVRVVNSCFVCVYEYVCVCVCVYGRVFINVCMNVPYLLETDLVIDGCIYDGYVLRVYVYECV